jgi:hypothetical protein
VPNSRGQKRCPAQSGMDARGRQPDRCRTRRARAGRAALTERRPGAVAIACEGLKGTAEGGREQKGRVTDRVEWEERWLVTIAVEEFGRDGSVGCVSSNLPSPRPSPLTTLTNWSYRRCNHYSTAERSTRRGGERQE